MSGAGPVVGDTPADDVDLAVDDASSGELTRDAHGGAGEPAVEAAVEEPDVRCGDVVDGAAEDVDGGAEDGVGGAEGGGGEGREGEEGFAVEREDLEHGGACAEREVKVVLGAVEEGARVEEEWGSEERVDWFGNEGEVRVVRTRDPSQAIHCHVFW